MQSREMWTRSKWKVVASAAAVTALGVGGIAIARDGDDSLPVDGIALQDLVSADTFQSPDVVTVDDGGVLSQLDSPLDDDSVGVEGSPDDDAATAEESVDSPEVGAAGAEESPDPPDDGTAEAEDSPEGSPDDSPDSPDD